MGQMRDRARRMLIFLTAFAAGLALWGAASASTGGGADTEEAAVLIDGEEASAVPAGRHTVTARGTGDHVWLAVYEEGRFAALSTDRSLTYDFPESGAEIRLFRLDSAYRPLGAAVRVPRRAASYHLVYSGQATCYPDEYEDFDDYIVRVQVVVRDGVITDVREIAGYDRSGKAVNSTNAGYLRDAVQGTRTETGVRAQIIAAGSATGIDAVTGATCASEAVVRAVTAALKTTPVEEADEDPSGGDGGTVPDGVYAGSAQCLTDYMDYMVDLEVTVRDGAVTAIADRTLDTPMSTKDRELYALAWAGISRQIADEKPGTDDLAVDAVSGATISSRGIRSAIEDALSSQTAPVATAGTVYAPEGISLYARPYPVVTVSGGKIVRIRVVPAEGTDTEALSAFADTIVARQSVEGLTYPSGIEEDAYAVAHLVDQILYGKGVLG